MQGPSLTIPPSVHTIEQMAHIVHYVNYYMFHDMLVSFLQIDAHFEQKKSLHLGIVHQSILSIVFTIICNDFLP